MGLINVLAGARHVAVAPVGTVFIASAVGIHNDGYHWLTTTADAMNMWNNRQDNYKMVALVVEGLRRTR